MISVFTFCSQLIIGERLRSSCLGRKSFAGLILALGMLAFKAVNPARLKHYARCLLDFRYDREKGKKSLPPPDSEACRVPFGVAIAAGLFINLSLQLLAALASADAM